MRDAVLNCRIGDFRAKKMPTIEIAGLCLPLKPQKERGCIGFQ
jgi:hypothetical protein